MVKLLMVVRIEMVSAVLFGTTAKYGVYFCVKILKYLHNSFKQDCYHNYE